MRFTYGFHKAYLGDLLFLAPLRETLRLAGLPDYRCAKAIQRNRSMFIGALGARFPADQTPDIACGDDDQHC